MRQKKIPIPKPGDFLLEDWLQPLKISPYQLAKDIKVPAIRISQIIRGKRKITPDTAIRLGKYFGVEPEYWLKLQSYYDIEFAKDQKEKIEKEVTPYKESRKAIEISHKTVIKSRNKFAKTKVPLHR